MFTRFSLFENPSLSETFVIFTYQETPMTFSQAWNSRFVFKHQEDFVCRLGGL